MVLLLHEHDIPDCDQDVAQFLKNDLKIAYLLDQSLQNQKIGKRGVIRDSHQTFHPIVLQSRLDCDHHPGGSAPLSVSGFSSRIVPRAL